MPTGIPADGGLQNSTTRTPIEQFSIHYDCEMKLATLLVDRHGSEKQTEMNIEMMIDYLKSVWYKSRVTTLSAKADSLLANRKQIRRSNARKRALHNDSRSE